MTQESLVGRRVGSYEIEQLLGSGGVGDVYRARDLDLSREVAIKFLRPMLIRPGEFRVRFMREARMLAGLEHPNIVMVYNAGEFEEYLYFVMQLLDGHSLEQELARGIPLAAGLRILAGAAEALAYAHERGLIHRDIKPANIMVVDGAAVLTDFGMARHAAQTTITDPSAYLGTPRYFSPEQATMERANVKSDIFALGVVLYELATGRHPFVSEGITFPALRQRIIDVDCPPPLELRPDLPEAVLEALGMTLQAQPEDREEAGVLRDVLLLAAAECGG